MSFDIVVLRLNPGAGLAPSLLEVEDTLPLGTHDEIRKHCDAVFSGISWSSATFGLYQAPEGYALELSIPEDDESPTSLHLGLFFGPDWEDRSSASFDRAIQKLYELHQWQSFAASDNSSLLLESDE
jgi:hypothetical protein